MERHLRNRTMLMPVLEEYCERNNIEYNFILMVEPRSSGLFRKKIVEELLFLHMIDTNEDKETLQFEEIDQNNIEGVIIHEEHIIPIAKRLIRQQKLKELGI